ncbi:coiled-coil domain-containing protein 192 isoform X4 [Bos javanicus]|uniref:coiled-coil domain-containing protein 192 isoform X4 n=1 Tax=Bos javanicus TaxID=9906 RepID=UPI002AA5E9C5|nr:coiled-coil domain-containing protein 192 isoform X4 [Bos javanicus]
MGIVDVCLTDRVPQGARFEMGECYSRTSVAPGCETPGRSSTTSGNSASNTQQRNTIPLAVSEGTKSKLLEQVSWLEKKLEALDCREDSGEPYKKMVLAKDQCIEKLQAEVNASQEQLAAYKLKHKRKLKKLQTDLATAKQEAAITVLELNEKIKTLCEGKLAPREDPSLEESCGGLPPVEDGDRKISLIMELSTQVSLQNERITQLEEVLEEKERKIQQLEAEREAHCFPEVKDSPECLQETPVFSNNNVSPVVYDEDL